MVAHNETKLLLRQRSLPEQVADHIVLLLATDKLTPGQRIFEGELCKELGVSRIPVREALRTLEAQGVVHTVPNRGNFIRDYSSEETSELLKVRVSIERLALRRVARFARKDPTILEPLREALAEFRRQSKSGDNLAACQADLNFHREIIVLSGSPVLAPLWESIARGVLVYFMHERRAYYDVEQSIDEHDMLIKLLADGKVGALDTEIERHILRSNATQVAAS